MTQPATSPGSLSLTSPGSLEDSLQSETHPPNVKHPRLSRNHVPSSLLNVQPWVGPFCPTGERTYLHITSLHPGIWDTLLQTTVFLSTGYSSVPTCSFRDELSFLPAGERTYLHITSLHPGIWDTLLQTTVFLSTGYSSVPTCSFRDELSFLPEPSLCSPCLVQHRILQWSVYSFVQQMFIEC